MVQTNTVFFPGADATLLRIKNQKRALAISLDGNSLYTSLGPKTGGAIAIAEACRNLACVGAYPAGVTNCLNFGNPEKPEIMWQFQQVIEGVAEACKAFEIPVTGGNVSFYNDTDGISILPTPVMGVVGIIDDINTAVSPGFKAKGTPVVLLGENHEELGASEYLKHLHNKEKGCPPELDLIKEKAVQKLCLAAISQRLLLSAHDLSEGGLAICTAECAFLSPDKIGCSLSLSEGMRTDALLFGESQSRILVTVDKTDLETLLILAQEFGVPANILGKTGGDRLIIFHKNKKVIDTAIKDAFDIWEQSIPDFFEAT